VRSGDDLHWFGTRPAALERFPESEPKSLSFIRSSVYDNQVLLKKDRSYLANLKALPMLEREQLLHGNWKIRPAAGMYFKREWFEVVEAAPVFRSRVRFWDRAGTKPKPGTKADWTSGVLLSRDADGRFFVEDVIRFQGSPAEVEGRMLATASQDGVQTMIGFMQDPGSAGVSEKDYAVRRLAGYNVRVISATGSKETRAKPVSSQAENGNIKIVRGRWNHDFLNELTNFPEGENDDQVDGLSGGFGLITAGRTILLA
jgi:predicted phage terminase large subunit-like protein